MGEEMSGQFTASDNSGGVHPDLLPVGIAALLPYWSPLQISSEGVPSAGISPGDLIFSKSSCGRFLSVNYNQFSPASFKHRILKQARGLIVGSRCGTEIDLGKPILKPIVFARPFDRFLNWEPGEALDGGTVYEKADGTLGILWFNPFDGAWALATRSCVHADIPGESGKTFRQMFDECLQDGNSLRFSEFTRDLNPMWTYLFEICHTEGGSVVLHKGNHLQFIGARHLLTGQVCFSHTFQEMPVSPVRRWDLKTEEEILAFVESRPAEDAEGVVVVTDGKLFKLKSKAYRDAHHITSERLTARKLYSLILSGKIDEIYSSLSEKKRELCDTTMGSVTSALLSLGNLYDTCENELAGRLQGSEHITREIQKARAEVYLKQGTLIGGFLFGIHKANGDLQNWISQVYKGKGTAFIDLFIQYAENLDQ
jgi:hypothetical protein